MAGRAACAARCGRLPSAHDPVPLPHPWPVQDMITKSLRAPFHALLLAALPILLGAQAVAAQAGARRSDWIQLFNGRDLDGWVVKTYHHEVGEDTLRTFRVEDGMVKVRYDRYGDFDEQFSHLFYRTPFSHYLIAVEYRFAGEQAKGAPDYTILNSGVMFHSQDPRTILKEQNWPISVEVQLLAGLPDGKPRPTGNMCSPGTDVVYNGRVDPRHCIDSSSRTYRPGDWVRVEALVLGDSIVKHIVDGDTVLVYSRPQMGGGVADGYDPELWQPRKPLVSGYVALQSEGQPVDFRRVELLDLKGCTDPKAVNHRTYFRESDPAACRYSGADR